MYILNVRPSSIAKKSAEVLFSPTRRCVTQKMFHSSSKMRAAKRNPPLLEQGREQLASSSSWRSYLIPIAIGGGIGGGLLFMHLNDEKRAIRRGQCRNDGCSSRNGPIIGGPFRLVDSDGRSVTEKDLKQGGNWILLYFGYTSSPDVGPAELGKLAKAIHTLDSNHNIKVRPVFVTIDPQRDNTSHLRAYLKEFDERIMGLTGPVGAVRQVAHEYRVFFKKVEEDGDDYLIDSSHNMYLLNPNMEIVRIFGLEYNAEQLSQEIHKEVKGQARGNGSATK